VTQYENPDDDPRSYVQAVKRLSDPNRPRPVLRNTFPAWWKRVADEFEIAELNDADDVVELMNRNAKPNHH
jgi:uncharacterized protein (DUF2236 family)